MFLFPYFVKRFLPLLLRRTDMSDILSLYTDIFTAIFFYSTVFDQVHGNQGEDWHQEFSVDTCDETNI